jgi:hypothetical protein
MTCAVFSKECEICSSHTGDIQDIVEKRDTWCKKIKENRMAAAANAKDLEGACLQRVCITGFLD